MVEENLSGKIKQALGDSTVNNLSAEVGALGERDKFIELAPRVMAFRALATGLRHKKMYSVSSWILAGTIAFIYSILLDPKKMIQAYGSWPTKTATILFIISLFYGIKNSISASAKVAFEESESLQKMMDSYFKHKEHERKEEPPNQKPYEQVAGEEIADTLISSLSGTSNFWIQVSLFLLAVGIFAATFFVRDFLVWNPS